MNFFEQQDRARQNTNQLLGLFVGAVLFIVVCIYAATILTINYSSLKSVFYQPCNVISSVQTSSDFSLPSVETDQGRADATVGSNRSGKNIGIREPNYSYNRNSYSRQSNPRSSSPAICQISTSLWHPQVFLMVLIITSAVIGGASWLKSNQLKAGGAVIAIELGGRRVLPEIATEAERQLLNVVEEMAIASGVPVPGVYLLDHEFGMNAFAAGFQPEDAVIGITKGLLDCLDRDELQGVIAHEFSHILNGDMTMNLRLTGMLHGILFVYLTGRVLTSGRLGSYNTFRNDNFLGYFGFALMFIGSSGLFCGRLIQSAVSRQREFLADASAVQFTRNSAGIASALAKLDNSSSEITSPYAETASHMFFSSALGFNWFGDLFATHPTLALRIQRVRGLPGKSVAARKSVGSNAVNNGIMGFAESENMIAVSPQQVRGWRDKLPALLQTSLQEEYRSISIIYALLIDHQQPEIRADQLKYLQQIEDPSILIHVHDLHQSITQNVETCWHLSLLDLAIDRVRSTPEHTQSNLLKCTTELQKSIATSSWHRSIVYLILEHRLHPQANAIATSNGLLLQDLWPESLTILATLARAGQHQSTATLHAFQSGLFRLPAPRGGSMEMPVDCDWQGLQVCLEQLAHVRLPDRKLLVTACTEVLASNKPLFDLEANLLRMIAIMLDCPLPPLLDRSTRTKGDQSQTKHKVSISEAK